MVVVGTKVHYGLNGKINVLSIDIVYQPIPHGAVYILSSPWAIRAYCSGTVDGSCLE